MQLRSRGNDVLAESAGKLKAHLLQVCAQVDAPAAAVSTGAAGQVGLDSNAGAGFDLGDAGANFLDHAAELVPRRDRIAQTGDPARQNVVIGVADRGCRNPDQRVAVADLRHRPLDHLNLIGCDDAQRSHRHDRTTSIPAACAK